MKTKKHKKPVRNTTVISCSLKNEMVAEMENQEKLHNWSRSTLISVALAEFIENHKAKLIPSSAPVKHEGNLV